MADTHIVAGKEGFFMKIACVLAFICYPLLLLTCAEQKPPASESAWSRIASPVTDPLHNGFFIDAEHGWILSYGTGLVLHTVDGGDTWSILARLKPIYYEGIHFLDRKVGWICGEGGLLLFTEDGGQTWHEKKLAPESVAFYGIYVPAVGRAVLVGLDIKSRTAVLLESDDLGVSWQVSPNSLPGSALEPIQFLDGLRGFIGGGRTVLRTTDGGNSWLAFDVGHKASIRGLHFLDTRNGWAVGHHGAIFRSTDGARTWQKLKSFTANRLRSICFLDNQSGFIVGDQDQEPGSLWSTMDGGKTWIRSDGDYADLHRLFRNPRALWAVGKNGTIIRFDL